MPVAAWALLLLVPLVLLVEARRATNGSHPAETTWVPAAGEVPAPTDATAVVGDRDVAGCEADDGELRSDRRWLCAVAYARCLARHNATVVPENNGSLCQEACSNITELFVTIHGDFDEAFEPKLLCRTTSRLVWHWKVSDQLLQQHILFVVSIRQEGNETWLLHKVISKTNFTVGTVPSEGKFQLRVQTVTKDGIFAVSCKSKWISTLNGSISFFPVINLKATEEKYEFSDDHLNMSIQWEPNPKDMACDYKILYWNIHASPSALPSLLHSNMKFSALLSNLDFNSSYKAYVLSGDEEKDKWGKERAELKINTPSCLDVWNSNLTICSPPAPQSLMINFIAVGMGQFDMNISWIPEKVLPEKYMVHMAEINNPRKEHKFVNGNTTSVIFKDTKPATYYMGCITAISSAGNSTDLCEYRKFSAPPLTKEDYGEIAILVIASLVAMCGILLIAIFFCYHHNKKRRENLQRTQYFESLDKEAPIEKNYVSTEMYFDDEWEISEDRISIKERRGGGAFGVVYRGLLRGKSSQEPLQEVAVKMLRDITVSENICQFQQEINLMKSVGSHPHIVSMIGCCTSSKQAKLIVEFCALGNLLEYLQLNSPRFQFLNKFSTEPVECVKYAELMTAETNDEPIYECQTRTNFVVNQMYFENPVEKKSEIPCLQASELLSFARQIAMGMEYLSTNRIVHRDLAARNVLVCSDKTMKISDFGLSKDVYEQNVYRKKGSGKLPFKWMAIESLMYNIYTTQSDVWSFGVLLWEIVTLGGIPYPGTPTEKIIELLNHGERMECPPNCSRELYDVMLSCWREKSKDRPTFTELRNKLDSLLESTSPRQYLNLNIMNELSPETSSSTVDEPSNGHK